MAWCPSCARPFVRPSVRLSVRACVSPTNLSMISPPVSPLNIPSTFLLHPVGMPDSSVNKSLALSQYFFLILL